VAVEGEGRGEGVIQKRNQKMGLSFTIEGALPQEIQKRKGSPYSGGGEEKRGPIWGKKKGEECC